MLINSRYKTNKLSLSENVVSQLFNGTLLDSAYSSRSIVPYNSTAISNGSFPTFLDLTASNNYVRVSNRVSDFSFGTGPFKFSFDIAFSQWNAVSGNNTIISYMNGGIERSWLLMYINSTNTFMLKMWNGGYAPAESNTRIVVNTINFTLSSALSLNTPYTIKILRNKNKYTLSINGTYVNGTTSTGGHCFSPLVTDGDDLSVGGHVYINSFDPNYKAYCYIKNIRFIKPTNAFEKVSAQSILAIGMFTGASSGLDFVDSGRNNLTITKAVGTLRTTVRSLDNNSPGTDILVGDGASRLEITNNSNAHTLNDGNAFTLQMYYKPLNLTYVCPNSLKGARILERSDGLNGWQLFRTSNQDNSNQLLYFVMMTGGVSTSVSCSLNDCINNITHIAISCPGGLNSTVTIRINGKTRASGTLRITPQSNLPIHIFGYPATNWFMYDTSELTYLNMSRDNLYSEDFYPSFLSSTPELGM